MDLSTGKALFALFEELTADYNRLGRTDFLETMMSKCFEFSRKHSRRCSDMLVAMQAHFEGKKEH